ncbi:MAG: peptidoglycan editing factor PgeF [Magnetococcales bacterium]|nr:peptidoglycan editing factor PgeF [Magnetococcales bacterium]
MKDQASIPFLCLKNIPTPPGVRFFFTTRHGGESDGCYESLNVGPHVGDDPLRVENNRNTILQALDPAVESLVFINQVHGNRTITAPIDEPGLIDGDALVTRQKHLALGIMTADCVPILMADVDGEVVAAVHAGWRGAVAGVLDSCIDRMRELGARPERVLAIIGPSIRPPNYEVDGPFRENFLRQPKNKKNFDCQKFFSSETDSGTVQFDLPAYVRADLVSNCILPEKIYDVGLCTYFYRDQFFSHRRSTTHGSGVCGRQMGGIYLC